MIKDDFPRPVVNPSFSGRVIPRIAVALNALEVCECLRAHLRELGGELGLGGEQVVRLLELAEVGFRSSTRLTSAHLTYPSISWRVEVVLGEAGEVDCGWEIALTPTSVLTRVPHRFTPSASAVGVQGIDMVPDNLRARWGLKVMMQVQGMDGKIQAVEVPQLSVQPRAARSVDLDFTKPVEGGLEVKVAEVKIPDSELLADALPASVVGGEPVVEVVEKALPKAKKGAKK